MAPKVGKISRPGREVHLSGLEAADVLSFVTDQCRLRHPASVTCGLRSFLRYCYLTDLTARFGAIRPPVSVESDHRFRSIPTTRFGVFDHPQVGHEALT
jgi:hypothetical protein